MKEIYLAILVRKMGVFDEKVFIIQHYAFVKPFENIQFSEHSIYFFFNGRPYGVEVPDIKNARDPKFIKYFVLNLTTITMNDPVIELEEVTKKIVEEYLKT